MNYILKNDELTVTLSDVGAELISVKRGDCEYVWQGDEKYWNGQAPFAFPICGRVIDGVYLHEGKKYELGCHGFAQHQKFEAHPVTNAEIRFVLAANEETKKVYPFDFELTIVYRLEGNRLSNKVTIKNTGKVILPATFGAHPGYNVPLDGKGQFEDYYLEFGEPCSPDEIVLTPTCFITGGRRPKMLVDGRILPLEHSLFDNDALFLARVASSVTLKSDKTDRFVTMEYPDMPYLGFWQASHTDAPYVCIEPWCGLPDYGGASVEITQKNDLFRLIPGGEKVIRFYTVFG